MSTTFDRFNEHLDALTAAIGAPSDHGFMAGVEYAIWSPDAPLPWASSLCLGADQHGVDISANVGSEQRVWLLDGVLPGEPLALTTLDVATPEALAWIADGLAAM